MPEQRYEPLAWMPGARLTPWSARLAHGGAITGGTLNGWFERMLRWMRSADHG